MSKRVLKTLKMSIRYKYIIVIHGCIVVLSAISECRVISLHKYKRAPCRGWTYTFKIDMK